MSAIQNEQVWDPFDSQFLPDHRAQGKSHFQSAFFLLFSAERKRALNDFYAYCRLVDDIADDPSLGLGLQVRSQALDKIERWIDAPSMTQNAYWNRWAHEIQVLKLSHKSLRGIIRGCRYDLEPKPLTFESWEDLNAYVEGVAVCVGQIVLQILGIRQDQSDLYAQGMGRCVQYINIMRDIDEDLKDAKVFIPQDYLRHLGHQDKRPRLSADEKQKIRLELWKRAINYRDSTKQLSLKCLPAELMVDVYVQAGKKYWKNGSAQRLTSLQKILAISRYLLSGRSRCSH